MSALSVAEDAAFGALSPEHRAIIIAFATTKKERDEAERVVLRARDNLNEAELRLENAEKAYVKAQTDMAPLCTWKPTEKAG